MMSNGRKDVYERRASLHLEWKMFEGLSSPVEAWSYFSTPIVLIRIDTNDACLKRQML